MNRVVVVVLVVAAFVFPSRAGRTRKPQHHGIVDRPLADIPQ